MAENLPADPLDRAAAARERPAPRRRWLGEIAHPLIAAVIFAFFVRTWLVQVFEIPSPSMEPGLEVGDQILVNKFIFGPTVWPWEEALLPARPLRSGDIAVFRLPTDSSRFFVKRCLGLPGDKIEIEDKALLINGEPREEGGYVVHSDERVYQRSLFLDDGYRKRDNFGPFFVPRQHYFCLGDNRDESNDSRFWGPVPRGHLEGRPVLVLWSKNRDEGALRSLRPVR